MKKFLGIVVLGLLLSNCDNLFSKTTYIECKEGNNIHFYQFNNKEFKWLYNKRTGKFKYTKKVKNYSKDKAFYVGNYTGEGIELGNRQDVEIFRTTGLLIFHWKKNDGTPMETREVCKKIKKLPRLKNIL